MTVIVTGASRGIGKAIADRLYSLGHEIIGISLNDVEKNIQGSSKYLIEVADVSDKNSLNAVYEKIKNKKISGLVNCAGIFESLPISLFPYDNYKKVIDVNLIGIMNTCSLFIKLMDKNLHTPIINIGSAVAHVRNNATAYTASKFAVEGFTSSLAKELSDTKIRPNVICPGMIETSMTSVTFKDTNKIQSYINSQPIGIPLSVDHVADVVELLFDPKSNCIGGQAIQIG